MIQLDAPDQLRQIDREGMIDRIAELPRQCLDAWNIAQKVTLPADYSVVDGVVVLGMGGSAIGGDLVRTLIADELKVPMQVVRDYDLPAFVGPNTLVVASSYSGSTEETITAFNGAIARKSKVLAITTGGKIKDMAQRMSFPLVVFDYKAQPRAALGFSFVLLLGVLQKLGLVSEVRGLDEAVQVMERSRARMEPAQPAASNPAKQMAQRIHGRLPIVYGGGLLSEVARRWKGQMNENSKAWSYFEVMPELNHNAVVGYEFPKDLASKLVVIFLDSNLIHPRTRLRYRITQDILTKRGVSFEVVEAEGTSPLAQMMSSIYVGDYVSYYLAILNRVDPTPVDVISYLKQELARA
ncbi:MAG: bifunctional phosphoglucose/phosphomannose isomerase [Chloroflexi bacterium]|nr:bifunctional phosphoglucose/phosphomannose isomerase [Chloroflexota bacterium]MDA8189430.1 bifunctional phosphoglucose/phosphomannose isomerase [Dehalococcoidales bacterium]